jgi:glucose repression regulatory protein TUP1
MSHWQGQGSRAHQTPAMARLTEHLEAIKHEFQGQVDRAEHHDNQLATQVQEMDQMRRKLWEIEQALSTMKEK